MAHVISFYLKPPHIFSTLNVRTLKSKTPVQIKRETKGYVVAGATDLTWDYPFCKVATDDGKGTKVVAG